MLRITGSRKIGSKESLVTDTKLIREDSDGFFSDENFMLGVKIRNTAPDGGKAVLEITMKKGSDCWLGDTKNSSLMNLVFDQVAAGLNNGQGLPSNFEQEKVLRDLQMPVDCDPVVLNIMQGRGHSWGKVSTVTLSNPASV